MYEGIIVMEISNFKDRYLAELQEHILYDPPVRPGMAKAQVSHLLPNAFPTARAWVASVNPPSSEAQAGRPTEAN